MPRSGIPAPKWAHTFISVCTKPDFFVARSLPFVVDSYTMAGSVDFDASEGDRVAITGFA